MTMDYMYLHLTVLFLNSMGIVLLTGALVFRSIVTSPALRTLDASSPERESVENEGLRTLKSSTGILLIILVAVSAADLTLRAQMMSRKPLLEVGAVIPLVLTKTHIGKVWLFKMASLGWLLLCLPFLGPKSRPAVQILALLGALGLCLSSSLAGHAADRGDVAVPVLADWLHVVSLSAWIGALFPLRFLLPKLLTLIDRKRRLKFESALVGRFSIFAVYCVAILLLSGSYLAWLRLRTVANLFSTSYGATLLFKISFLLPVLVLGEINRYYVRPSLQDLAGEPAPESWAEGAVKRVVSSFGGTNNDQDFRRLQLRYGSEQMAMVHLKLFVALQCLIAVLVVGLGTSLSQTSPPDLKKMDAPESSSGMQGM